MIKDKIQKFINKYNLSGTFIVAFSGGYDSMCLLDVLYKMNFDIVAIHLNHNWRGEESRKEEKNCKNFAKQNNIKYYTETLPDNIEKTETTAREARYDFFKRCAKKFNSNVVFTAHNFDDNAETVLYRIAKGTGIVGLQGISEHRDIFYRPLLTVMRKDIEAYCQENNLTPNIDSSNNNTKYKRNLLRQNIIPLLKEINPNVIEAINSLSELAVENNKLINEKISTNLLKATEIEQKYIIYDLLTQNNIDYDREKIENIQKFINENKHTKSGKTISLTKDLWLFVSNQKIEIIHNTTKDNTEIIITECGSYKFGNQTFTITKCDEIPLKYPPDNEKKAYISTDKINFTLRHRLAGDRIKPLGSNGTQKLKKYLNEKKIPQHEKDNLVLLCKDNNVLWVAGYGISEEIKVVNNPTHVITLK